MERRRQTHPNLCWQILLPYQALPCPRGDVDLGNRLVLPAHSLPERFTPNNFEHHAKMSLLNQNCRDASVKWLVTQRESSLRRQPAMGESHSAA